MRLNSSHNFYLLLDGNYPILAYKEFINISDAIFNNKLKIKEVILEDLIISQVSLDFIKAIMQFQKYVRIITLTKIIGLELLKLDLESDTSITNLSKSVFKYIINLNNDLKLPLNAKFKVDILKKGDFKNNRYFSSDERTELKHTIADAFIKRFGFNVNLNQPDIQIQTIISSSILLIGVLLFEPNRKAILNRSPSQRSYFHPASMSPLLIRSMLNLSLNSFTIPLFLSKGLKKERVFLDPFMGGGGMILEANEQGFKTIGLEIGYWECRGARMNLSSIISSKNKPWTIIRTNSIKIPIKPESIDLIVSDPPYGQSTILKGIKINELIQRVIKECYRVLKFNSRMVISIPDSVHVSFFKFEIIDCIQNRVHRSLTRNIYILQKVIP